MENPSKNSDDTISLSLSKSANGKIHGYYCAVKRNGNKIDGLLIELTSFDIEKSEFENITEETDIRFDVSDFSNIELRTVHTLNDILQIEFSETYFINEEGKFQKK